MGHLIESPGTATIDSHLQNIRGVTNTDYGLVPREWNAKIPFCGV